MSVPPSDDYGVFFPEEVSAAYPYSADGSRFWAPETPFVDPFVSISAMAAVTERIRFLTNVVKLPIRDPLMVAKQLSSYKVPKTIEFVAQIPRTAATKVNRSAMVEARGG